MTTVAIEFLIVRMTVCHNMVSNDEGSDIEALRKNLLGVCETSEQCSM